MARISWRPANSPAIERTTDAITYAPPANTCPRSNSKYASKENVENVVNPPQIPIVRNTRQNWDKSHRSANDSTNVPIKNEPTILMMSVPQGKLRPKSFPDSMPTKYRATDPIAPPKATAKMR